MSRQLEDEVVAQATPRRGWPLRAAAIVAFLGYTWVASSFGTFTWPARAVTLIPGIALLAYAGRHRPPRGLPRALKESRDWRRGFVTWVVVALATGMLEMSAFMQAPRHEHPTLSSVVAAMMSMHLTKWVAWVLWLLFGAWLVKQ